MTFARDSQSHKSQSQRHKFTTRKQLTQFGRMYTVTRIVFDVPSPRNPREYEHILIFPETRNIDLYILPLII